MQRRTALFLSLAAGVVATLAWVVSSLPEAPPPLPVGPPPAGPVPPSPPSPPEARQDPAQLPADAIRVRIEVVAREQYVPPSPVRVQAVQAGDGRELPTQLLAGAGAGFDASPRAAGASLVAIEHDEGRVLRQVALSANETARPTVGSRLVVQGTVRGADGKPVSGCRVWFGAFDRDGQRREVEPDETGAFRAEVPAGLGVPFVVRAPGHATMWRVVAVTAPPAPCDAVLARACVVEVQVAAQALAMHEARLFVVPRPAVATALAMWPFFEQVLGDGVPVDASGRALVEDLPAGGEVGLLVRHPRAALGAPTAVVLKGERVRAVVPLEFAATTWQAVVVDETGQPLPATSVWARSAGGSLAPGTSQRLLPPHLDLRGSFAGLSEAAGAFTVGAPAAAGAVLTLRRAGHAGRDLPWSPALAGTPLVLPAWRGGEVELRVLPPRAGTAWFAECDLAGGGVDAVAADQAFRISLPHPGRFDLVLTTWVGKELRGSERHDGVHATGAVELAAPRLP